MEFEFTTTFYVAPSDFEQMCDLARNGITVEKAVDDVAYGWDDIDYFAFDYVRSDVERAVREELEREV